jgi:hypothetical protein
VLQSPPSKSTSMGQPVQRVSPSALPRASSASPHHPLRLQPTPGEDTIEHSRRPPAPSRPRRYTHPRLHRRPGAAIASKMPSRTILIYSSSPHLLCVSSIDLRSSPVTVSFGGSVLVFSKQTQV